MRRLITIIGAFSLCLGGLSSAGDDGKHRPSLDDLMALKVVRGAEISPDGTHVAFVEFHNDFEADKDMTQLWIVPTTGGEPVQLTHGDDSVGNCEWSADGKWIAFLRGGKLNLMRRAGGESRLVDLEIKGVRSLGFSPDGSALAFIAGPKDQALIEAREKRYGKYEVVREDGNYNHLWLVKLNSDMTLDGEPRQLTDGRKFSVTGYNWSPDSSSIAFAAWPTPHLIDLLESQIYVVDVQPETAEPLQVTSTHGIKSAPIWKATGDRLAFTNSPGFPNTNSVFTVRADGESFRQVAVDFPGSPSLLRWDADALLFAAAWRTSQHLYRVEPSGKVTRLTEPESSMNREFSFSDDGQTMAYLTADGSHLSEIELQSGEQQRQLTQYSAQLSELRLPTKELIHWTSDNGLEIEGILTKPHDFKEGQRYPLYVRTHGGPTGTDRPSIAGAPRSLYSPEVLVGQGGGALVLQTNYRGSASYGEEFQMSNLKNLGIGPARDIIAGVEMLIEKGWVDPEKVACLGWSQGGHISAMLSTYSDICTAAIMGAGISDWRTYYYNTDITQFTTEYFDATPLANDDVYAKTSPVTYIDRAKTPVLIQHGERDQRVPIANGYQFRQLLLDKGVEARMIVYEGMGHGPSTPRMRRAINEHALAWFAEHLFSDARPDFVHPVPADDEDDE